MGCGRTRAWNCGVGRAAMFPQWTQWLHNGFDVVPWWFHRGFMAVSALFRRGPSGVSSSTPRRFDVVGCFSEPARLLQLFLVHADRLSALLRGCRRTSFVGLVFHFPDPALKLSIHANCQLPFASALSDPHQSTPSSLSHSRICLVLGVGPVLTSDAISQSKVAVRATEAGRTSSTTPTSFQPTNTQSCHWCRCRRPVRGGQPPRHLQRLDVEER